MGVEETARRDVRELAVFRWRLYKDSGARTLIPMLPSPLVRFGTSTLTYAGWQGRIHNRQCAKSAFVRDRFGGRVPMTSQPKAPDC